VFYWRREATGREDALVVVGTQVGPMKIRGIAFFAQATHTGASRGPSAVEERFALHASCVQKLLLLLQPPKLIFQVSKIFTNFCVHTRNQEQPILFGIGRKSIVDLK
jgi:hypothetical protein